MGLSIQDLLKAKQDKQTPKGVKSKKVHEKTVKANSRAQGSKRIDRGASRGS